MSNVFANRTLSLINHMLPVPDAHDIRPVSRQPIFIKPRSVLLVASLFIGDNILLTPMIRNLRRNLGTSARLDLVATAVNQPLFETCPHLNQVFIEKQGLLKRPELFLKQQAYDTVILCRYSPTWGWAAFTANVPQRVGFDLERLGIHKLKRWGACLTHSIPSTPLADSRPQVEVYLDILRCLGLFVKDNHLECRITPADEVRINQQLRLDRSLAVRQRLSADGEPYRQALQGRQEEILPMTTRDVQVLIHATTGSPGKKWPMEHWRQMLVRLHRCFLSIRFFATGSAVEAPFYDALAESAKVDAPGIQLMNLCGGTNLRESIVLMSRMDLVVTLDTSVAHLAALAGVPRLVVLYGPTNQAQWRPMVRPGTYLEQVYLDLPCHPCIVRTCEHKTCMRQLTVDRVLRAVAHSFEQQPLIPF